jgi:TolB-like protein/tetratricopeptide (TPR) repeat protein
LPAQSNAAGRSAGLPKIAIKLAVLRRTTGACRVPERAARYTLRMVGSREPLQYEFDRFRIDPVHRLLFEKGAEEPVPLPPRVFDTLLYFVERPGELVSKVALMGAIWPNVVVEENSLNQSISALRRVLGETPAEHRFIVTAPGKGYRFVAPVRLVGVSSRSGHPAAPVAAASDASVAVLPFANLTGDPAREYFGEAIAAELIHTLSRIPKLKVPARTSTFAYKGRNLDVRSIARELGVRQVLEGSIHSIEDRVRISAQLVDGTTGYHVWSHSLERPLANLFELQDELVRTVAKVLDVSPAPVSADAAAQDTEAYQLYMQALSLTLRPSGDNVRGAIELLRAALKRDPGFARASSLLAIQYGTCVLFGFRIPDALAAAERETRNALALDPADSTAHCAAGVVASLRGRWLEADRCFTTSYSVIPDPLTSGMRSVYLSQSVGKIDQALREAEDAFRAVPSQPIGARMLAALHLFAGRDDEARRYAEISIGLGQPINLAPLADIHAQLALRAGRYAEAAEHLIQSLPHYGQSHDGAKTVELVCLALKDPSRKPAAISALQRLQKSMQSAEFDPPMRKRLMLWHTQLGAIDAAYDVFVRSLSHYEETGTVGAAWGLLWLPEMRPFRQDPRFRECVRRLRFTEYWAQHGPPDRCESWGLSSEPPGD